MARTTKAKLSIVKPSPAVDGLPAPKDLGRIGAELWSQVVAQYAFDDPASIETLRQACASADLAEEMAAQIKEDGVLLKTRMGVRDHPLIKHEIAAKSFVVRTLARLGLDLEPLRAGPGRPPSFA